MRPNQQKSNSKKIVYTYVGTLAYRGRLLKQLSSLQAAGYDCRLVYGDFEEQPLNKKDYDFPIEVIPTHKGNNPFVVFLRQLRFGYIAGRRIAASDATHVISFSLESLLAGALAKRRRPNLTLVFDSNELHIESYVSKIKKRLWAPIQRFCLRYCDVVMHAEGNRLEYFKEHHDRTERPHFLLENFPRYIASEKIGVRPPEPPIRVLYVGMMGKGRYTSELIDVFRKLAPNYSLDLVGPILPRDKEKFERELRKDPEGNIRFLPPIPYSEMASLIERYHVGIALYKNTDLCNYYCAPNKVYDYLMSGVPVIANNYPGLVKVLEDGKLGACIEEVDYDNFRAALETIYRERRWENITDAVRTRYSWEGQVSDFLSIFSEGDDEGQSATELR